jgi:hypothetical protein
MLTLSTSSQTKLSLSTFGDAPAAGRPCVLRLRADQIARIGNPRAQLFVILRTYIRFGVENPALYPLMFGGYLVQGVIDGLAASFLRCRPAHGSARSTTPPTRGARLDPFPFGLTHLFVMAGLVPAIHALVAVKTWMPGHQGVHARLRRAMPGHDER